MVSVDAKQHFNNNYTVHDSLHACGFDGCDSPSSAVGTAYTVHDSLRVDWAETSFDMAMRLVFRCVCVCVCVCVCDV